MTSLFPCSATGRMLLFTEEAVRERNIFGRGQAKFDFGHIAFEIPMKYPCEIVKIVNTQV